MGLSYHFKFCAPATKTPQELEIFLRKVEKNAQKMRFKPTMVLNAVFDTAERREFARRLTTGYHLEDERLRGVVILQEGQVWNHDVHNGYCRVIPEKAVALIVTDEHRCEVIFGFMAYPKTLKDINGKTVLETGIGDRWFFRDFVDSPDKRYRQIVQKFAEAGFLESEQDEYAPK